MKNNTTDIRTAYLLNKVKAKYSDISNDKPIKKLTVPHRKNILVLAPHPDDEVIGCAGLIQKMVCNGCNVTVVVITNENHRSIVKPRIKDGENIRLHEARNAKNVLGYESLVVWPFMERGLESDQCSLLTAKIKSYIKENPCDVVLIPCNNDMHPDHRSVCDSALRALANQGKNFIDIYLYEVWGPCDATHYLFLSPRDKHKKIAAMRCYQSQLNSVHYEEIIEKINEARIADLDNRLEPGVMGASQVECYQRLTRNEVITFANNKTPGKRSYIVS